QFRAAAKIRLLREAPDIMIAGKVENTSIRSSEDFNTHVEVLNSARMVSAVGDRIRDGERRRLMAPYEHRLGGSLTLPEVLQRNRRIAPSPASLVINVLYSHPDRDIAAMVANYF